MKKILFVLAILSFTRLTGFAQGTVSLANTSTTLITTNMVHLGPPTGPTGTAPKSYYYTFFWADTSVTSVSGLVFHDPNWTFAGQYATNSTLPGRLLGGPLVTVPGHPVGSLVNFVAIGWSGNFGNTLAQVQFAMDNSLIGWYGQSDVAVNVMLGGNGSPPAPQIFGSGPDHLHGFNLDYTLIPEPSLLAPAMAIAIVVVRRRRIFPK